MNADFNIPLAADQQAVAAQLQERLDLDTVIELSRQTDPTGVLSIYLDARPGTLRAASIDIKNRLAELRRRVAGGSSPEQARRVQEGIARLDAEIERLIDPEQPGRGPFIHPLLELLDEGAPTGVVLASRSEAQLFDWRLGELTLLRAPEAEVPEPGQDRPGPIGSRPARRYGTPTGARVTPVEGAANYGLAEASGIAALLRW